MYIHTYILVIYIYIIQKHTYIIYINTYMHDIHTHKNYSTHHFKHLIIRSLYKPAPVHRFTAHAVYVAFSNRHQMRRNGSLHTRNHSVDSIGRCVACVRADVAD